MVVSKILNQVESGTTIGMMNTKHLGSHFDDSLAEEGLLDEAEAVATKRVWPSRIGKR